MGGWYRAHFQLGLRGVRNEAPPAQQLVVGSEVATRAAGAGRLSPPETLFMKGSSREHCSPGQGTRAQNALLAVEVAPQHLPFFFSPFEPLLAVPLPPCLGAMDGGDGLGTDSPGGAICAGVRSTGAEKLNSIFN